MKKLELKIPPLALFLIFVAAMWLADRLTGDHDFNGIFRGIGMALFLLAGAYFGIGGLLDFRRASTTVNPLDPEKCTALVTDGTFRYSRNPMYLALLFTLAAWGLFLSNLYALVIAIIFVPYMNRFQVYPEEQAMENRFGEEFSAYRRKVRRWI